MKTPTLSIIIPAYKEETVIGNTLDDLLVYLRDNKLTADTEVIVVSAGKVDNTANIAKSKAGQFKSLVVLEPESKIGKGRDVREGIMHASGGVVIFMDADLATPLHHIKAATDAIEGGADIAIGIRQLSKIHNSPSRRIVSVITNRLVRLLAVRGVPDTQCGFKAFTNVAAKKLFSSLETLGWGFDMEILARAQVSKLKVVQIRINDWHDPKDLGGLVGESPIKAILRTLTELLKIGYRRFTHKYN